MLLSTFCISLYSRLCSLYYSCPHCDDDDDDDSLLLNPQARRIQRKKEGISTVLVEGVFWLK
jgi:hypothetical protein